MVEHLLCKQAVIGSIPFISTTQVSDHIITMKNIVLNAEKLTLDINIGVTDQERKFFQNIYLFIKFKFIEIPIACLSDDIKDTICYHEIANIILNHCRGKHFKLIEALAYDIFELVKRNIPSSVELQITVQKPNPLKNNQLKLAEFTYGEF